MSTTRAGAGREQGKPREARTDESITLEELKRRIEVANKILSAINIEADISAVLWSLDYGILIRINDYKLYELERYLNYDLLEEVKETIVRAVFAKHHISLVSVDYSEVGFAGWEVDECAHYGFVKLADGRYALIYSCDDEIEYALPK
jgi:hypothetical protein